MKNFLKLSLVFTAAVFFMTSCNKEKAAVKKLDGEWTVASSSASVESEDCGGTTVESTSTYTFEAYDVSDEEEGTITVETTVSGTTTTLTGEYSVNEDADELTFTYGTFSTTYTIESLSKSELKMSLTDTEDVVTDCGDLANGVAATIEEKEVTTTVTLEKN